MDADGNVTDGGCAVASVTDGGPGFVTNDPAPDFIAATPDGQYMMLSLRGPAPVSAIHAAHGSCPVVGVVKLEQGGMTGSLVAVWRSTKYPWRHGRTHCPTPRRSLSGHGTQ